MVKVDHDTPRESEHPMTYATRYGITPEMTAEQRIAARNAAIAADQGIDGAAECREAGRHLKLTNHREATCPQHLEAVAAHNERVRISREERAAEHEARRARIAEANANQPTPTHVVIPEGVKRRRYESTAANDHDVILTAGTYPLQTITSPEGRVTAVYALIPATAPAWSAATALLAGRVLASEIRSGADNYGLRVDVYNFDGAPAELFGLGWAYDGTNLELAEIHDLLKPMGTL